MAFFGEDKKWITTSWSVTVPKFRQPTKGEEEEKLVGEVTPTIGEEEEKLVGDGKPTKGEKVDYYKLVGDGTPTKGEFRAAEPIFFQQQDAN